MSFDTTPSRQARTYPLSAVGTSLGVSASAATLVRRLSAVPVDIDGLRATRSPAGTDVFAVLLDGIDARNVKTWADRFEDEPTAVSFAHVAGPVTYSVGDSRHLAT